MATPVITKPSDQSSPIGLPITPLVITATNSPTEIDAANLPKGLDIVRSGSNIGEITGTPKKFENKKVKLKAKHNAEAATDVEFEWSIIGRATTKEETNRLNESSGWNASGGWATH